ncbi:MAG TPA: PAS-domain containing protein, partial [Sphingomonadaceae bacterium]|nr:PAS-domain containing protein [Sphingomonadaceae bacterium]
SATPGRVVLWWFDATDTRAEMARLGAETERLGKAIDGLSGLIEAAPFPMWYRGPDLRLALVNSAYVRAVEAPNAADVVARGLELVEAHDGKGPLSASAAASDEGRIATRTVPATIAGARRMIRIVDVPLGNGGIAGYAIDVEELEQARADLGRFARAQRDMLDLLSAGVAQFAADRTLVFSNQPFQRLFAMKPEWLADRPEFDRVLERMREANRLPDSRDFPGWKAERRQWFLAGEDPSEDHWLLPDGVHLRVLAQPLPDGGLLLIFEDRTEQVQLASARDTLLRVRAATFDNLFEAVGVFASDGRLHLWNNRFREAWGLSEEDLARHPRVDRLVEAVSARLTNPRHAGLIRELVRIATVERRQRSGRVALTDGRSFEFAVVPLPDGNALFAMLDVTDSRRIERALRDRNEALEEADKLKDAFVASMSYELRTPLTSISGFAEMLRDGYAGALEPVATDYVSAILASVETLRTLIDSVLDLTQVEAGSLPIADEPVDLAALVTSAAAAFEPVARERMIDFDVDVAADTGVARGDSRRLRQALDHVLRNALTYTPSGGRVLLRAAGDGAIARIVVSDNGEGIPA